MIGSTFFGGGGGGSREEGDALVELMKEEGGSGLEIPLVQVSQMETKRWTRSCFYDGGSARLPDCHEGKNLCG